MPFSQNVRILDNGSDISNSCSWKSVDMVSVLTKETGNFRFSVSLGSGQTYPATTVPVIGDLIQLYDSSGVIFGGPVTEVQATIEGLRISWQVIATDWGYLFDGTLVKKNYAMLDPHDIVLDIVSNFCAGKGFTTSHVQAAHFLIPSIKFNYQQPSKALQSLAKLIGWDRFIDANKDLHFFLGDVENAVGEGGVAPITIDGTSGQIEWNSLDVDLNIQNMQNAVYVIGGTLPVSFSAGTTNDVYQGDGVHNVFSVAYGYTKSSLFVT